MSATRIPRAGTLEHFGRWLSHQRKARDLTQEDLAEQLGCSVWSIQKIEVGNRRPSRQVAELLASFFDIPAAEQTAFVQFARGLTDTWEHPAGEHTSTPEGARLQYVENALDPGTAAHHNNLQAQLTSFVGRGVELPRIHDLIRTAQVRLLTLTGPPGTGKTRLALQVAAGLLREFEGRVFFVNLAPVTDPQAVISEIAQSLSVPASGPDSLFKSVEGYMDDQRLLLVLDNFEQVVEAAPVVGQLLSAAPGLKVLATSRVPLHIRGEKEYSVPPLQLPDPDHLPPLDRLSRYEAIQLFVQRAGDVSAEFELTDENASAVAHICVRLDGLPLAIELAAARVKVLSPQAILARLESSLHLLTGGSRDLPARQRTLRSAIEWSYDLLAEAEKELFRRLAVFVGGRTIEAIQAVCTPEGNPAIDVLDGIASLVDKSLLRPELAGGREPEDTGEEPRFVMLETIHEYASEKLQESSEAEELSRRHAHYFLALAEAAEPHLQGAEQAQWFMRLEREHNNLKAAISWSLARGEEEMALRFGAALMVFWYNRYPSEARWWLEGALKGTGTASEPTLTRARALHSAALALRKTREYAQARRLLEESLSVYRLLGDKWGIASCLHRLADFMSESGSPEEREYAQELYSDVLGRFSALGDRQSMSKVLNSIGERARTDRDYSRAVDAYERSMVLGHEMGDKQGVATTQTNLAYVLYHSGDYSRAKHLLTHSLRLYREVGSAYSVGWALIAWAGIVRAQGRPLQAARLVAAADRLVAPGGAPFDPIDQLDREEIEAAIRADLSADEWPSARGEGDAMSMEQAIEYALQE